MKTSDYIKDRAKGCIFGALAGDCLGITSEFYDPEDVVKVERQNQTWPYNYAGRPKSGFEIGESTDDGELTMCLLESIFRESGSANYIFHPHIFVSKILEWKKRGAKGIGKTTQSAITLMKQGKNWHEIGRELWEKDLREKNFKNASNGSLMRLSPVPALFYNNKDALFGVTVLSCVPTHYNIEVLICCLAFSYYCAEFIKGENDIDFLKVFENELDHFVTIKRIYRMYSPLYYRGQDIISLHGHEYEHEHAYDAKNRFVPREDECDCSSVFDLLEIFFQWNAAAPLETCSDAKEIIIKNIKNLGNFNPLKDIPKDEMGYVVHTLMVGIWAVLNSESFEEGIQKVARIGLDADTYGSVAGAMLGAKYGLSGIPERYIEPLWYKDKVNKLLDGQK